MDYKITISIPKLHDIKYAQKLRQQYHTSRSDLSVSESAKRISVKVEAEDIVALTAACNSVLKEIRLVDDIASIGVNSAKKQKSKNI